MSGLAFMASLLFCCLMMPNEIPRQETKQYDAMLLMESNKENTFCQNLAATFKMMVSSKMMKVNLTIIWGGCSICYWSTMLAPIIALQVGDEKSDTDKL